jgi:hypothetical protein
LSPYLLAQWLAVFALHGVSGALSIGSFVGLRFGPPLAHFGTWIFGYGMPVLLTVYVVAVLVAKGGPAPVWARALFGLAWIVTLVGGVIGGREYVKEKREETERRVKAAAEQRERDARRERVEREAVEARMAALKALPPDADLRRFIEFISDGDFGVRETVATLILARPTLVPDLAALLQSEDRVLALKCIWWRLSEPPRDLAGPFHECIASMPDWTRRTLAVLDETHATEVNWACEAIVILADRFVGAGQDFRPAIARLSELLEKEYAFDGFRSRALLQDWLKRDSERPKPAGG